MNPNRFPPCPDDEQQLEMENLVRRAFDDDLSPDEFDHLQQNLACSATWRGFYLDYAAVHALLGASYDTHPLLPVPDQGIGGSAPMALSRKPSRLSVGRLRWSLGLCVTVLPALVVAMGFFLGFPRRPVSSGGSPVAWQVASFDALTNGAPAIRPLVSGDRILGGDSHAFVRFANGVELSLSNGGDAEILSGMSVRLHSGQLQANVGDLGRGFTVLTPTAEVVDLGTIFGVGVSSQQDTEVVVFSGEVTLGKQEAMPSPPAPTLLQGEAVRIHSDGSKQRITEIWQNRNNALWSTSKAETVRSPIASVQDNLSANSPSKYYAIVPNGFREDAKVYVDRIYDWNSLPGCEFPPELLEADYIQTFNEDKHQSDLEILLTLSSPAKVYVLIDERHLPPDWLTERFVKTDIKLGIDLGWKEGTGKEPVPPLGIKGDRFLAKGPGISVDVPVSVWVCTVPAAGQILLGPNGERSEALRDTFSLQAGSMYGIVVTELSK